MKVQRTKRQCAEL